MNPMTQLISRQIDKTYDGNVVLGDKFVHCGGYETSVPTCSNVVLKFAEVCVSYTVSEDVRQTYENVLCVKNPSFVLGDSDNIKTIPKLTPSYIAQPIRVTHREAKGVHLDRI